MRTIEKDNAYENGRQVGASETLLLLLKEDKISQQVYDEMIMRISNFNIRKYNAN